MLSKWELSLWEEQGQSTTFLQSLSRMASWKPISLVHSRAFKAAKASVLSTSMLPVNLTIPTPIIAPLRVPNNKANTNEAIIINRRVTIDLHRKMSQ